MLQPVCVNLPNLLLNLAGLHPPKRRGTVTYWNSPHSGSMEPWVLTDSELSKSATHRSKIVLSEARSVKTPSLTQNSLRSASTLYFVLIKLRTLLLFIRFYSTDLVCVFVLDNLGNLAGLVCLVLLDVLERRIGDHVVTQDPDGGIMKVSPTLQDVWLS